MPSVNQVPVKTRTRLCDGTSVQPGPFSYQPNQFRMTTAVPKVTKANKATTSQSRFESQFIYFCLSFGAPLVKALPALSAVGIHRRDKPNPRQSKPEDSRDGSKGLRKNSSASFTRVSRQAAKEVRFKRPANHEAAGTAALTSAKAACSAASLVWSRDVFKTVPPSPLSLSRTLSAVTLRTSTKSAAVPG